MSDRPSMTSAQFAEQFQFTKEVMADWPEWKKNILVHSLSPTSHRRTPMYSGTMTKSDLDPKRLDIATHERRLIEKALKECEDHRGKAAEMLGISIRTLQRKMKQYRADDAKTT